MNFSRRDFLMGTTAWGCAAAMPSVFQRAAWAAPQADQPGAKDTVLVVIQLSGGNDGLNTVIPFADPAYAAARPVLKQSKEKLVSVNDQLGLHPALTGFGKLLENSQLSIVQGVGYPQPNRSHFSSMDIWHKAGREKEQTYGWLGRTSPLVSASGASLFIGDGQAPLALYGATGHPPTIRNLDDFQLRVAAGEKDDARKRELIQQFASRNSKSASRLNKLVQASALETYRASERIREATQNYQTPVAYPETELGQRLKLIAQLINGGISERIFYTSLDGFDTHAAQLPLHDGLMSTLSGAVEAFQQDVKHHGHEKRVVTITFSEFGRRVKENGSLGTDHGAASQMFFVGEPIIPGVIGAHPSLTDLDDGDLKHHTDFRSIYATVLDEWLGVDSVQVLGERYAPVKLFAHQQT
ncbi:MAG: DUF1501 domain-containing protein [Planctomycetaceae bacterium]